MSAPEMSLDDRKAAVLRAIVSHYVSSGEPVGSKTLVERYRLGVSPATVRNDMGVLEDGGYIYQPHTSAGRIPTDVGYRYFVDAWAVPGAKLTADDERRVHQFFGEPRWELEDALRQAASFLSGLTHHAAVVFAPALERSVVRHVDLVGLTRGRAMLVLVTDSGRVENHVVAVPDSIDEVQLDDAAQMLNRLVAGSPLETAAATIAEAVERFPLELKEAVSSVGRALDEELARAENERVFLEGTSTIVDEEKFSDLETVRDVIGTLEHRRLVLEVLADALSQGRMSVRIGSENTIDSMKNCAVITSPYGSADNIIGSLGIVGPTRMDYKRSIAAVFEVASNLGRMLGEIGS